MIKLGLFLKWESVPRAWLLPLVSGLALSQLCACTEPSMIPIVDAAPAQARDAKNDGKQDGPDVAIRPACNADAGPPTKSKGDPCNCNSDCRTGYCADGVCCASSCDVTCKACNLPGSLGECSLIPRGVPPAHPAECQAETPATCGRDGTCDGNGGCQLFVQDTICDNGACDGDGLVGVRTCDGKGKCEGDMSTPCAPFSCNRDTNACQVSCTTNAECAQGQECSARSCGRMLNGFKCTANDQCVSGYCSNGYCCNVACSGPCVSCALPSAPGRCQLIAAGQPSLDCEAEAQSTCGTTGFCDGAGACELWPADVTPCATSSCAGTTLLTATAVCDGKGQCQSARLTDCSPYRCANGMCYSQCRSDAECESGRACVFELGAVTGTCGQKPDSQSCTQALECLSGHCVDGVCCESACEGACRSCALPGAPGQCTNVPAGTHDPRKTCVDEGVASCGYNGLCDGAGACRIYPAGTKCGGGSCANGRFTDAPTCNQNRQCLSPLTTSCSPYVCNGNTCFNSCTRDADCVAPNACVNGSCGKKENGADCSAASECLSGFCAQGVCCNFACSESCKSCSLAATRGQCTAVPDGAPDPQEVCKVTDKVTCGTTGACRGGTCAYVDSGIICKPAACAGTTTLIPPSACDGRGVCLTPANTQCAPYTCSANVCLKTCSSDGECQAPSTCVNNQCGLKAKGAPCTAAQQCASGLFCTEGVCCDSACSDGTAGSLCVSCKVGGKVGTCTAVAEGQPDPKQRCVASDRTEGDCSNNGTCNGQGACSVFSNTTCDDGNQCTTGDACQTGVCKGTAVNCTAQDQCHDAGTCNPTTGVCSNPAKANGATCSDGNACTTNNTCQSGACSDGTPVVCPPPDQCHDAGTCNTATGVCSNPAKANGATCSDGNACTQTDTCQSGTCTSGSPVVCPTPDQCHDAGTCDSTTGVCSNPAKADGTTCSDGSACTLTDTCQSGTCTSGSPVVCPTPDQCHDTGTCDSTTGACSNPSKADGTTCSDGDECTKNDTCQTGACTSGSPVVCPTPDQCHDAGTCNSTTGACSNPSKADGTTCSNGSACTTGESCQGGVCGGGSSVSCTSPGQCRLLTGATCDPSSGACSYPPKLNSETCDDGNACTQTDTCQDGACAPGTPVTCTTTSSCQVAGICDPSSGCPQPTPTADGTPCGIDGFVCVSGECPTTCTGDDACDQANGYTCDLGTGLCTSGSG